MALARSPRTTTTARRRSDPTGPAVVALRVATWNLRHGRRASGGADDLGAVAARIAALDADVVAVQEVDRLQHRSGGVDQVAELAERLGWCGLFAATMVGPVGAMRPAPRDGAGPDKSALGGDEGGPAYGIGLLSRQPLSAATTTFLPATTDLDDEPRAALQAAVCTSAGDVGITATHLSWLPWKAWRQAQSVIRLAAARPGPAVVIGDLNLPRCLVRAALRGTGWHTAPAGATYPGRRALVQLDHVLVRGAQTIATSIGPAYPSDHRVVSAALVLP